METPAGSKDLNEMLKDLELGAGPFVIAGRTFRQPESKSIAQEAWVEKRYRSPLLVEIARGVASTNETLEDFSERLTLEALDSGIAYEILAGLLVEDGVAWSRDTAQRNAQFFGTLTATADKQWVYDGLAGVLFRFLKVAAVSKLIFQSSLPHENPNNQHDGDPSDRASGETRAQPVPASE